MCGHFHFPFFTSTSSSSKCFFKCITLITFWKFSTVKISEIKETGTCQKKNSQGTNSYTLLLLNLISLQIKVYFELLDISEYQFSACLHLLLLLLTLKDSI